MTRKKSKIFVLDTSVLLHDHQAITNFESYFLLEEADTDEALEYFINLEVSNFSNEYSRQQGLENESPF